MHAPSPPKSVLTTCPYCGVGCGVKIEAKAGAPIVSGDPQHPANFGRLCSKGSALGETVGLEGRLLHPARVLPDGTRARMTWNAALDEIAAGFHRIVAEHGPDSVAFYLSGQLLTEDYYVPNKLMKGFIGSANVDTNSRLCMASSVAGHRRAFGADTMPGVYEDLDTADLILLVGSNTAWCHPVLYRRMVKNRAERGAKIVVIDPRRTATCEDADLFLPIAPGMDAVLFSAILADFADHAALDFAFIERHTEGFENALARAREIAPNLAAAAQACGVPEADLMQLCAWFRATARTVTCYSQGVNQSAQGTDKVNAIINCHLATGRIGKPGMGPFSLTGQPNAMGGREVGGLANQLAAHMGFGPEEIARVQRFWNAPQMARREGRKTVEMFDDIAHGRIRALWVMGTNPAMSLPRADGAREALRKLDLFVVSENAASNDTTNAGAHYLLPAAAWGEKDGTVTNSERRISRQRAFLPLPGEARPDWWIVSQVAQRLGHGDAFAYTSPAQIFREHAALSGFENNGTRDFDIGGLAGISDTEYDALEPVQWPISYPSPERGGSAQSAGVGSSLKTKAPTRLATLASQASPADLPPLGGGREEPKRFFADGRFFTPDCKARFITVEPPALREKPSDDFPLRLNTGRVRDQWHSMTRTGRSARLAAHIAEPYVEIHPADAASHGIADGGFAQVRTPYGVCTLKVVVSEGQRPGSLFVPIHWSGETSSHARAGALVTARNDPHSGQPEMKATPAAIAPIDLPLRGFLRSRRAFELPADTWWVRTATPEGPELRIASARSALQWHAFAQRTLGQEAQLVEFTEAGRGIYRAIAFIDGEFDGCLSIGPGETALRWNGLAQLIAAGAPKDLTAIPLQVSGAPEDETGAIVCACHSVGAHTIREAVSAGAATLDAIGERTGAGKNCGSCLPELKRFIARARALQAATAEPQAR